MFAAHPLVAADHEVDAVERGIAVWEVAAAVRSARLLPVEGRPCDQPRQGVGVIE